MAHPPNLWFLNHLEFQRNSEPDLSSEGFWSQPRELTEGSLKEDTAVIPLLSASVFMPLITTPHQACLHIVHRWQRWSPGWRPPKPELFIFCEGGKKILTSAKKVSGKLEL